MTESCAVCGRALPVPSLDQTLRGGRPRESCGPVCKRQRDARLRTLARLARWELVALERGEETRAAEIRARTKQIRALPFSTVTDHDADPFATLYTAYMPPGQAHERYLAHQTELRARALETLALAGFPDHTKESTETP